MFAVVKVWTSAAVTGRSTRFLRQLGFEVTGVDIAEDMIRKARELDPSGDYRLLSGGQRSRGRPGLVSIRNL